MELKDLASHSATLEKAFGMTSSEVSLFLELLNKKKIAKPIMAFKASAANMAKPGKKPFVFVEEEKGSYFFYNLAFPMLKKDIQPKLKEVEKSLAKAKDEDKEALEAQQVFLEALLDRIKKKKWLATSGKMAWKSTNDTTKECFMNVEGKVEGQRKSTMDVALAQLGYDFADKNGNLLRFIGSSNQEAQVEAATTVSEESTDTTTAEPSTDDSGRKKRGQQLNKIDAGITKMQDAAGRVSNDKLLPNMEKYEQALAKLRTEAEADGTVDETERAEIEKAEEALAALRQQVEQGEDAATGRDAKKAQNKAKIEKYKAQLDQLAKKLGIR